jgi:hypothetical protein
VNEAASKYAGCIDRPIFIGACPRSGTTLLRTMLNTHPDIAIPRETRFMPFFWEHRLNWLNIDRKRVRERFGHTVFESDWTRADRLETSAEVGIERLSEAPPTLGSLVGTCYVLYAEATGKKRWGDKRPMYARYLDSVFTFFPDAQYINLVRDPRASVASMRKLNWFEGDVVPGLELWVRSIKAVAPWRKVLHTDQYLEVRYEDMAADPEANLERIADYLNLDRASVPVMLTYHEHVDETATRYHSRLSEPVSESSVRSWEAVLSSDEIALIEHVSRKYMAEFEYEPAAGGRKPPTALLHAYRAHSRKVARERAKVTINEYRRLVGHRKVPIAAKLTSGQRDIHGGPAKPAVWKRNIGKPR